MTQLGKAVIDRQEGGEAGVSRDAPGAPFSLPAFRDVCTYSTLPSDGGGMAGGYRSPSRAAPPLYAGVLCALSGTIKRS